MEYLFLYWRKFIQKFSEELSKIWIIINNLALQVLFEEFTKAKSFQYNSKCSHFVWLCMECFHWCKIIASRHVYFSLLKPLVGKSSSVLLWEQTQVNLFLSELWFKWPNVIFIGFCNLWPTTDRKAQFSGLLSIELVLLNDIVMSFHQKNRKQFFLLQFIWHKTLHWHCHFMDELFECVWPFCDIGA